MPDTDFEAYRALMVTYVDTAGIGRIKVVPGHRIASVAAQGATASVSAATLFASDDYPVSTPQIDATIGDLRIVPDLGRLVLLDSQRGLGWAPSDLRTMAGETFPGCHRSALRAIARRASEQHGLEVLIGLELEFTLLVGPKDEAVPAHTGPGYGVLPFLELEAWHLDLLDSLIVAGVPVAQLHPEYGDGQIELSFSPRSPVDAVDDYVLARTIVVRTAARHGFHVAFGPLPTDGNPTNGLHIHLSASTDDAGNVFHDPGADHGISAAGGGIIAGVIGSLREGIALLGGTTQSFFRLQPHNWAGAYVCWGDGNREAAVRLMRGPCGLEDQQNNIEVKCADGSANPYLAVAAVIGAGLRGLDEEWPLPPEVAVEPGTLSDAERERLGVVPFPTDLGAALEALRGSAFFRSLFGDLLLEAYLANRLRDWEVNAAKPRPEAARDSRWRH